MIIYGDDEQKSEKSSSGSTLAAVLRQLITSRSMSCRLIFTVACRARPTKFCSRRAVINVSSSILRSSRLPPPSIASRVLSTSGQNNPNGPPNMRSDNRAKEEGDGAGVNDNGEDEAESSKGT